jgi:hypothetical protein
MSAYHQIGHDSWNLVAEPELESFAGLVLSPVNDDPATANRRLSEIRKSGRSLEVILDPQLYRPASDRGELMSWQHFDSAADTADPSDVSWWRRRGEALVFEAQRLGAHAVCTPLAIPRVFDDSFYVGSVAVADAVAEISREARIDVLQTAIVHLDGLSTSDGVRRIASILTGSRIERVYLILFDPTGPRRQRSDYATLTGAMELNGLLATAGTRVMVPYAGIDMVLWTAAGAEQTATGKFFNLRRFVPDRWEDPKEKGRVVPYWTDGALLTWLREADLRMLRDVGLVRPDAPAGSCAAQILDVLDLGQGDAWLALGWRQYLSWFCTTEAILRTSPEQLLQRLRDADTAWGHIAQSNWLALLNFKWVERHAG